MTPLALVVENDSGTQRLLTVLLKRLGYDVDALAAGSEALVLLDEIRYDLALLDFFLPNASGTDVLRWMRVNRAEDLSRTLMLSSAPPAMAERVRGDFPEVRIIQKPFELGEIVAAAEAAKQRAARAELTAAQTFARRSVTAGAKAGLLVRNSGIDVSLVHAFGYQPGTVERWFPMHLGDPFPITVTMQSAQPHFLATLTAAALEFPRLEPVWREHGSLAVATVPVVRDGAVIGAAGWTFGEPQLFDEAEQLAFTSIADEAAQAIQAA